MLLIDQYKHIKKRADFFPTLAKAIQASNALLQIAPDGTVASILKQLEAIRGWTANGREPTKQERWQLDISLRLSREFESPSDPRIVEWADFCREVAGYYRHWLDDAILQTVDEDDVPYFPEDEDDDTHLLV